MSAASEFAQHPDTAVRTSIVDGNALAGMLGAVFAGDPTVLVVHCRHCGAESPLATMVVELDDESAIARCRGCTRTLLTVLDPNGEVAVVLQAADRFAGFGAAGE